MFLISEHLCIWHYFLSFYEMESMPSLISLMISLILFPVLFLQVAFRSFWSMKCELYDVWHIQAEAVKRLWAFLQSLFSCANKTINSPDGPASLRLNISMTMWSKVLLNTYIGLCTSNKYMFVY